MNKRKRELEFEVGDKVWPKVALTKGIIRFGKRSKLALRYIGPYEILDKVGKVAYRLALPPSMSCVHNVFHVSMLKKCRLDTKHVIAVEDIQLEPNLTYREKPRAILTKDTRRLRNKLIPMVKVQWSNHSEGETTWETEKEILEKYLVEYLKLRAILEGQNF